MSCDNIIDTGKCYIQGDTYNPYVMSISSLGVPLDISNGWTFFVEIKNSNGNIVKTFTNNNGLSIVYNKLVITFPKYFDLKKGEYIMYVGFENLTNGKKTVGGLRFNVVDKKLG